MKKIWENNGTEEIGLVTPIPGRDMSRARRQTISRTNNDLLPTGPSQHTETLMSTTWPKRKILCKHQTLKPISWLPNIKGFWNYAWFFLLHDPLTYEFTLQHEMGGMHIQVVHNAAAWFRPGFHQVENLYSRWKSYSSLHIWLWALS